MNTQTQQRSNTLTRRVAAAAMAGAAALAIAGFTALGSVFDYPQILQSPPSEILELFRANETAVSAWFLVLTIGAALLAPIGLLLGRSAGGTRGRWIAVTGVAAAAVQVVGLSRWFLFVPGISVDALDPAETSAAQHRFETLHTWLGTIVGETIGYALTAAFTALVSAAIVGRVAPAWLVHLGFGSAVLIATGTAIPLGLHLAELTNFAGYVIWCVWLIVIAGYLWRARPTTEEVVPDADTIANVRP